MCLESRDLFKFWEINDNISLKVHDGHSCNGTGEQLVGDIIYIHYDNNNTAPHVNDSCTISALVLYRANTPSTEIRILFFKIRNTYDFSNVKELL